MKNELLVRYLDVWTATMLHGARRVTFTEGYAGAGLDPDGGSPVAALRVFGEFADRLAGRELALVLVEADPDRLRTLDAQLTSAHAELGSPAELSLHLVPGTCSERLIPALEQAGALGKPIFGYLDSAQAGPVPFRVVSAIAGNRASELLITLDPAALAALAEGSGDPETGDEVFGSADWRGVADQPPGRRYPYLVTRYRESLRQAGLGSVLHVELVDQAGDAQLLFFATGSAKNLERLKDELWAVDEYAGVRYRDPRDIEQTLLDISLTPQLRPLRRTLLDRVVESGESTVAELRRYTLAETVYRAPDATRILGTLLTAGELTRQPERGRLAADTVIRPARP